jgi:hypothetical protein
MQNARQFGYTKVIRQDCAQGHDPATNYWFAPSGLFIMMRDKTS